MCWRDISVDGQIGESDRMSILETIPDERMNQEELLAAYQEEHQLKQQVIRALEGLSEKERYVIEKRVTSEAPLTLQEIADHFSISRERVRQIEERGLAKLRQILVPQLTWTSDINH
jgi:RNA polymerase sigma-32 factor